MRMRGRRRPGTRKKDTRKKGTRKKAPFGCKLLVKADFNILAPDQGENRFSEHFCLDLTDSPHCE